MKAPVYLDYNSTTPLDPRVLEAMLPVMKTHFGNAASSTHSFGWHAAELVQIAREEVATLIAAAPEEIIFTSGATEANNLAIKGVLADGGKAGKTAAYAALSAVTEHKSVLDPLQSLAGQGVMLNLIGVDSCGSLKSSDFVQLSQRPTTLASIMMANNEIGTIHDIAQLAGPLRGKIRYFHCDATQAAGKIPIDVRSMNVDLMSLSAHKFYGPKGIGALYISSKQPPLSLAPLLEGGGHERGYRSGTLNVPAIVGMGKACAIAREEMEEDREHCEKLCSLFLTELRQQLDGIELNGPQQNRLPGNLNLSIYGLNNSRLIGLIGTKIAISFGSACQSAKPEPSHVLQALGIGLERQQSSLRISFGRFSTEAELTYAAEVLAKAVRKIRRKP